MDFTPRKAAKERLQDGLSTCKCVEQEFMEL